MKVNSNILTPFRKLLVAIFLCLFAAASLPYIRITPPATLPQPAIFITYALANSTPDVIAQQMTSEIEGTCSQLRDLKRIDSYSGDGFGSVQLYFGHGTNMAFKRLEVKGLIRQLFPKLPLNASYPLVSDQQERKRQLPPLLVYSLIGSDLSSPSSISMLQDIKRRLSMEAGVDRVVIGNVNDKKVIITYDPQKCKAWGIDPSSISASLIAHSHYVYPGSITNTNGRQVFITIPPDVSNKEQLMQLPVMTHALKSIPLQSVAIVEEETGTPDAYVRINGKDAVNIVIYPKPADNILLTAEALRTTVSGWHQMLPQGNKLTLEYDNSIALKKTIGKNLWYSLIALIITLLLVALIERRKQVLLYIFYSLIGSAGIVIIMIRFFQIEIHLSTLPGLAFTTGVLSGNSLLLLKWYRLHGLQKSLALFFAYNFTFLSIIAGVLFFPEHLPGELTEVARLLFIALIASVCSVCWFPPQAAILSAWNIPAISNRHFYFSRISKQYISFMSGKLRMFPVWLLVLACGFPSFLLPATLEGSTWYHRLYNTTIGSETYQMEMKEHTDRWLGGLPRFFFAQLQLGDVSEDQRKTSLSVNLSLPQGHPIENANHIFSDLEKALDTIHGVDQYLTRITSAQSAQLTVYFEPSAGKTSLPVRVYDFIQRLSSRWGNAEWRIEGLGPGYNYSANEQKPAYKIMLTGYNPDVLAAYADTLALQLKSFARVQHISANSIQREDDQPLKMYTLTLDPWQAALSGTHIGTIGKELSDRSLQYNQKAVLKYNGVNRAVFIQSSDAAAYSSQALLEDPLPAIATKNVSLQTMGNIRQEDAPPAIYKSNRQFCRMVSFEYLGPYSAGRALLGKVLNNLRADLPMGFKAQQLTEGATEISSGRICLILLIMTCGIFYAGTVLLESIRRSLIVLCTMLCAFAGVMLYFIQSGAGFDYGGYAAFLFAGCITANGALNILYQFRQQASFIACLKQQLPNVMGVFSLVVCGLVPFLTEDGAGHFWQTAAKGITAGLIGGLLGITFVLPAFFSRKIISPSS